jgi:hypothetical protein
MAQFDFDLLFAAVQRKVTNIACPACNGETWGGGDVVLALPVVDRRTGNGYPEKPHNNHVEAFPVTCDNCGLMRFFSVALLLEEIGRESD